MQVNKGDIAFWAIVIFVVVYLYLLNNGKKQAPAEINNPNATPIQGTRLT